MAATTLFFMFMLSLSEYNKVMDRSDCEIDEYNTECAKPKQLASVDLDKNQYIANNN